MICGNVKTGTGTENKKTSQIFGSDSFYFGGYLIYYLEVEFLKSMPDSIETPKACIKVILLSPNKAGIIQFHKRYIGTHWKIIITTNKPIVIKNFSMVKLSFQLDLVSLIFGSGSQFWGITSCNSQQPTYSAADLESDIPPTGFDGYFKNDFIFE